ncbi:hypothetical protein ACWD7Y_04805 [Streptomyces drozdowiczii]
MTSTKWPRLETPEGGSVSQPQSPSQWHSRPYVWAFHAIGGALSTDYIERVCKQAAAEDAPPDAVYKTRDDDPSKPGEWITVGLIANADQQDRTRRYAQALVEWADSVKASRKMYVKQSQAPAPLGGGAVSPPVSEAGGRMAGMDSSTDPQPEEGSIDIGPSAIDRRYPLTYGPVAIHLGIEHYREDNVEECLRRARAFFKVFDDAGLPFMRREDGTQFSAEDVDEKFIRHHLGRHPGFGRTSDEEFDEHVARLRAKYAAPAGA